MMYKILLVGLGGGVGSILRFLIQRSLNAGFPFGTLSVNLAGCFLIGLLWGRFLSHDPGENTRLFLLTGICGGFTTFSAFTQESISLLQQDKFLSFLTYILISVAGGLTATFIGFKLFSS